jgi:murein DD-endopeptidase MepM/ murein hydrolase activator NlpD
VYSIGHGAVTYAAPLGWGGDKGTIVVRHVFPDGSTVLSFYGHLDPPSVVLNAGECVTRGEQIGRVGRPISPPHLHFEIRTHMPNEPGPGYWSSDPALAGWKAPSEFIWDYRLAASPGVLWSRPFSVWGTREVAMLDRDTFVAIEDYELIGIDVLDGSLRWSQAGSMSASSAVVGADGAALYTANYSGRLEAFRRTEPDATSGSPLTTTWKVKLEASGPVTLMPLPGGGVVASFRQKTFALSAVGTLLWERDALARPFDWALAGEQLIFSTAGDEAALCMADASGLTAWPVSLYGHLAVADGRIWVYGEEGVHRLAPETLSTELVYALPLGLLQWGDMVPLPDGGVLLTHSDAFDRRLIVLDGDGALRWERSYASFVQGYEQRLLVLDGQPYFVSQYRTGSFNEATVYAVDMDRAALTRIFAAGSRNPSPNDTWAHAIGAERLLINAGSGRIIALDTRLALEAVSQE